MLLNRSKQATGRPKGTRPEDSSTAYGARRWNNSPRRKSQTRTDIFTVDSRLRQGAGVELRVRLFRQEINLRQPTRRFFPRELDKPTAARAPTAPNSGGGGGGGISALPRKPTAGAGFEGGFPCPPAFQVAKVSWVKHSPRCLLSSDEFSTGMDQPS